MERRKLIYGGVVTVLALTTAVASGTAYRYHERLLSSNAAIEARTQELQAVQKDLSLQRQASADAKRNLLDERQASATARQQLREARRVRAEDRLQLREARQGAAEARRQLKALDSWAPGIIRSFELQLDGISPNLAAKSYSPTGSYLGMTPQAPGDRGRLRFDEKGLPQVKYGETFHYNPVTMAQFALSEYGGQQGPTPKFMVAVEKLLSMQGADGALRYDFPFTRYTTGEAYEPGWVSGMAQGQALSVFARAYALTKDARFLDAGNRALAFMMLPYEAGGTATTLKKFPPAPSDAIFIMEYPQDPPVYTLNGYMFSIVGLFDWALVTGNSSARDYAERTIKTLKILLPYYDLGVISAYDLSFITLPQMKNGKRRTPHVGNRYHRVHIQLLWALHNLTGEHMLNEFANRWLSYVDRKSPNCPPEQSNCSSPGAGVRN